MTPLPMPTADPAGLQTALWAHAAPEESVYVLLDAARDTRVYPNVLLSNLRYTCLYRGAVPEELAPAAPYLVELDAEKPFTRWLLQHGWRESWGVFCTAAVPLGELARHFRRFLLVRDEAGRRLYFRYYDPRVLRAYLPTCTPAELETVFGPVTRFLAEGPDASAYAVYRRAEEPPTARRLVTEHAALPPAAV